MSTQDPREPRVIRFEEGEVRPVSTTSARSRSDAPEGRGEFQGNPAPDTRASADERMPGRSRTDLRPWLLGGAAAVVLGVVGGLLLSPRDDAARTSSDEAESAAPAVVAEADTPSTSSGPEIPAARETYRNPEAAPVERALKAVRADFASGGASAVAQSSRNCFNRLAQGPTFGNLDYCLAYDAYGAALARRLAAGRPLPEGSWFGDVEARGLRTASAVVGTQGDAAARILDIRRLTVSVASANPALSGATGSAAAQTDTDDTSRRIAVAEAPSLPPARIEIRPQPAPTPRPAPRAVEAPEPAAPPPAPIQRATYEPASPTSARPSFNCRSARSASERMVCSDPVLAAADWRLHNVFERAMATSSSPRALRAEQDRWLAAREAAAPDPRAVLQVYETRIDELAANY